MSAVKFHWRLLTGGDLATSRAHQDSLASTGLPDLESRLQFCRRAEECGLDSLLTAFHYARPDPILLSCALGLQTEKIKFIIAYRSGLICPTSFVQQLNTLSTMIGGRFYLDGLPCDPPPLQ